MDLYFNLILLIYFHYYVPFLIHMLYGFAPGGEATAIGVPPYSICLYLTLFS